MVALQRELKRAEWLVRLYESHFLWLSELRRMGRSSPAQGEAAAAEDDDTPDPARHWLFQLATCSYRPTTGIVERRSF